ncbi:MAG: hypothetical protein ABIQ31_12285 [Ferruginibacter sp.]
MFKNSLLLGAVSGILAGIASIIYQKVYAMSLGADFAGIAKPVTIILAAVLSSLVAASGYWLANKWLRNKGEIVFNLIFVIFSFASIFTAFGAKLPIDIEAPELFPGLVVPMHFFPALAWFTLKPLFIKADMPYKKALV